MTDMVLVRVAATGGDGQQLADRIERDVRLSTGTQIHNLHVEVSPSGVRLEGVCSTFYCKQLAQEVAITLAGKCPISNEIEVQ